MRHLALCGSLVGTALLAACGGGAATPQIPVPDSDTEAEEARAPTTEPAARPGARDIRWYVSRGRRAVGAGAAVQRRRAGSGAAVGPGCSGAGVGTRGL